MDLSLDDYAKQNKISSRGGRLGGPSFNKGSADDTMPSRSASRGGRGRGGTRGRGGARGRGGGVQKRQSQQNSPQKPIRGTRGRGRGQGRGGRGGGRVMASEADAVEKLMKAKKTLQAAIKEAAKYANAVHLPRGSSRGTMPSRRAPSGNDNRYLDRMDEDEDQPFYNNGNRAARGNRGRGRGRGGRGGRGRSGW